MTEPSPPAHPPGKHRYRSVVEGMDLANDFASSRLTISAFARERGVSCRMVQYWTRRARRLATESSPGAVQVATVGSDGSVVPDPSPSTAAVITATSTAHLPPVAAPTIEVRLPNGVRIGVAAGFSPEVLTQVIACLGRPC